jgi:hypothetical protein
MDSDSGAPPNALPVIELRPSRKPPRSASSNGQIGIAAMGELETLAITDKVTALDVTFPPIGGCPSTAFTFNGGAIGTADPVQLLFWGTAWQTAPLAQVANTFVTQVKSILSGPYMSGLLPYGVRRCPFGNARVIASNPPLLPNTFTDQTVQNLMQTLIDNGTFPEPDESGGRNLYFVIMPPNTQYQPPPNSPNANGAHSSFSSGSGIDPDNVWLAWVGNNPLGLMTSTFTHELVEMCTDPEPPSSWWINGAKPGCTEIGDVCNLLSTQLNGGATVQSYWSTLAAWVPASQSWTKACLVPTAWSVRRTLAAVGKNLGGKGLRSLQNPIPSMNQFIVNV